MSELTPQQKKFCELYAKSNNATQSAIDANYSVKSARSTASRLLTKDNIKDYIKKLVQPDHDKRIADIAEVMEFFTKSMRGEVKDQFDLDATLRDRLDAAKELKKRYEKLDDKDPDNEKVQKVVIINDVKSDSNK